MTELDQGDLHMILDDAVVVLEELCSDADVDVPCQAEELCGESWCARVGCLADKLQRVRAGREVLGLPETVY